MGSVGSVFHFYYPTDCIVKKKIFWALMCFVFFISFCLSDNAQGRLLATHTKCVEGVLGEWTDQVLYV